MWMKIDKRFKDLRHDLESTLDRIKKLEDSLNVAYDKIKELERRE